MRDVLFLQPAVIVFFNSGGTGKVIALAEIVAEILARTNWAKVDVNTWGLIGLIVSGSWKA